MLILQSKKEKLAKQLISLKISGEGCIWGSPAFAVTKPLGTYQGSTDIKYFVISTNAYLIMQNISTMLNFWICATCLYWLEGLIMRKYIKRSNKVQHPFYA